MAKTPRGSKPSRLGQDLTQQLTRENAKVRYENLASAEKQEAVARHEDIVDVKIKMAMAEGEFDNLPGKGKPLDLKEYYDIPEHLRAAYQIMKNSGHLPEEVRLKKEMEILKVQIAACPDADRQKRLQKRLAEASQQYHVHMEYNRELKSQ